MNSDNSSDDSARDDSELVNLTILPIDLLEMPGDQASLRLDLLETPGEQVGLRQLREDPRQLNGEYRGSLGTTVGDYKPTTTLVLRIEFSDSLAASLVSGDLFADKEESEFLWSFISTGICAAEKEDGERVYLCTMNAMPDPELDEAHRFRLKAYNKMEEAGILLEPLRAGKREVLARVTPVIDTRSSLSLHKFRMDFHLGDYSEFFRRVRVSRFVTDRIAGTPPLFRGDAEPRGDSPLDLLTVDDAFEAAGVKLDVTIDGPPIDANLTGEDKKWSDAELHDALVGRDEEAKKPGWKTRFLIAGRSAHKENPSGIMFDDIGLSRQGVAIFAERIKEIVRNRKLEDATDVRRQYLFTAVHELSHAFNLLHSFQQQLSTIGNNLNRPAALSWMNYPSKYPFGENSPFAPDKNDLSLDWEESDRGFTSFFSAFAQRLDAAGEGAKIPLFDKEELRHLRHAPYQHIVMGGTWAAGEGGEMLQEDPSRDDEVLLSIETSDRDGPVSLTVSALEPLNLYLRLANLTDRNIRAPGSIAPGAGATWLSIRRVEDDKRTKEPRARRFRPIARACDMVGSQVLRPGEKIYAEISPMFGADGWYILNPGLYGIQAVCKMPGGKIIKSRIRKIDVERMPSLVEKGYMREFDDLNNLGCLIALNGSRSSRFDHTYDVLKRIVNENKLVERHKNQLGLVIALRDTQIMKRPSLGKVDFPEQGRQSAKDVLTILGTQVSEGIGGVKLSGVLRPPYKGANLRWTSAARQAANALGRQAIGDDPPGQAQDEINEIVSVVGRFLEEVGAPESAHEELQDFRHNWDPKHKANRHS